MEDFEHLARVLANADSAGMICDHGIWNGPCPYCKRKLFSRAGTSDAVREWLRDNPEKAGEIASSAAAVLRRTRPV